MTDITDITDINTVKNTYNLVDTEENILREVTKENVLVSGIFVLFKFHFRCKTFEYARLRKPQYDWKSCKMRCGDYILIISANRIILQEHGRVLVIDTLNAACLKSGTLFCHLL